MNFCSFLKALRYAPRNISRLDVLIDQVRHIQETTLIDAGQNLDLMRKELGRVAAEMAELTNHLVRLETEVRQSRSDCQQGIAASVKTGLDPLRDEVARERGMLPCWWEQRAVVDPSLRTALSALCGYGDTVFDVGANMGAVSVLLSRLVGPTGRVCAFEASPRVMYELSRNLLKNLCPNVFLVHAAVHKSSDGLVELYYNQTNAADSIVLRVDGAGEVVRVPTLALDDFVRDSGLTPSLVKMDIEGAEPLALEGMKQTVSRCKPHMVMETFPSNTHMIADLRAQGYRAFESNTLSELTESSPLWTTGTKDIVYVHRDRISKTVFGRPFGFRRLVTIDKDSLVREPCGTGLSTACLDLPPGMYRLRFCHAPIRKDDKAWLRIVVGAEVVGDMQATWEVFFLNHQSMVFSFNRPEAVRVIFDSVDGAPVDPEGVPGLEILSVDVGGA